MGFLSGGSTTIQAPPAPNYGQSMREVLTSQIELMPQVFESEQKFQPLFAQLEAANQRYLGQQALEQAGELYPQVADIEAKYTAKNRAAELAQLKETLPQYQAAMEQLSPGYQKAVAGIGQLAQQAAEQATQRPELKDYAAEVAGPSTGQYLSKVQEYQPGSQMDGVGRPREAGFLRGVQGPQLSSGLENINQGLVQQYVRSMPGMEQIAQQAGQVAQQELAAGRGLTPEEERISQQAARQAYAARGMVLGPQATAAEVLNRADVANQRFQQRLGAAQAAQGMVQQAYAPALAQAYQRQAAGAEYGLSAQQQLFAQQSARENLAQQIQQQRYAQGMGREQLLGSAQAQAYQQAMGREDLAAQTQAQAFGQALQRQQADLARRQGAVGLQASQAQMAAGALGALQGAQAPALQAFYKQPILQGQAGAAQNMGLASQQAMGPQLFNPESQTGMGSIYGAYNAQTQLAAANAQARAGAKAGTMGMIGSLGGAALKAAPALLALCWVAREVYGEANPRWIDFRSWMLECAPKWFLSLYIRFGERVARFISNKPRLKSAIKIWMDSKIESFYGKAN
jgi:hypothetical protein